MPEVFKDNDDFYVQGETVVDAPMTTVPAHESLVRIPGDIMREAIIKLQGGS